MPYSAKQERFLHAKGIEHKHDTVIHATCEGCGGKKNIRLPSGLCASCSNIKKRMTDIKKSDRKKFDVKMS